MTTFIKVFRFIVGKNVVEENCLEWQLSLKFIEIIDIVSSKSLNRNSITRLNVIVSEHHEIYLELYGNLKPKHHNSLHYARVVLHSGNLSQLQVQ